MLTVWLFTCPILCTLLEILGRGYPPQVSVFPNLEYNYQVFKPWFSVCSLHCSTLYSSLVHVLYADLCIRSVLHVAYLVSSTSTLANAYIIYVHSTFTCTCTCRWWEHERIACRNLHDIEVAYIQPSTCIIYIRGNKPLKNLHKHAPADTPDLHYVSLQQELIISFNIIIILLLLTAYCQETQWQLHTQLNNTPRLCTDRCLFSV